MALDLAPTQIPGRTYAEYGRVYVTVFAGERLAWTSTGERVVYALPKPGALGQTAFALTPLDFLDRLAALVRPRAAIAIGITTQPIEEGSGMRGSTWGQNLSQYLHGHCVISRGALAPDGRWIAKRGFLFPVRALSVVFRAKYLEALQQAF